MRIRRPVFEALQASSDGMWYIVETNGSLAHYQHEDGSLRAARDLTQAEAERIRDEIQRESDRAAREYMQLKHSGGTDEREA